MSRVVAALRQRVLSMVKPPIISELEFIAQIANHGQFCEKLRKLGQFTAANEVQKNAFFVGLRWLGLASEHLRDAELSLTTNSRRATFSRSYYAVYNASKAVRYIVGGSVSLKGDDHHKASDLPDDFPNADRWAEMIPKLYEHRLFSDYDNWLSTEGLHSLPPDDACEMAREFVSSSKHYLHSKFGI